MTRLSAIALLGLMFTAKAQAQYVPANPYQYQYQPYPTGPFYVGVDMGGVFMQSVKLKNLGQSADVDPGVRGDFTFGYHVAPPLAIEFETGTLWNQFSGNSAFGASGIEANLYQIPFLANLVFHAPLGNSGISVYVGGGAGGEAAQLDLSQENFGVHAHAYDTDFTFAYEGKAGLKYAFAPNMEVGIGYKFLGTLDHKWFNDNPGLFVNTGPLYSHSVQASFTWHF